MERARRHLVADLEPMAPPAIAFPVRHPTQADAEALDKCAERGRQLDGSANRSLEPNFVRSTATRWRARLSSAFATRCRRSRNVMTAASRQGRELATLMRATMATPHAAGLRRVELWVTAGNGPAEKIYERLGFRDAPDGSAA